MNTLNLKEIDLYFYVTEESSTSLLKEFNIQLRDRFQEEFINFVDWHDFFKYLIFKAETEKINIVFDEFQNFQKSSPEFFLFFKSI